MQKKKRVTARKSNRPTDWLSTRHFWLIKTDLSQVLALVLSSAGYWTNKTSTTLTKNFMDLLSLIADFCFFFQASNVFLISTKFLLWVSVWVEIMLMTEESWQKTCNSSSSSCSVCASTISQSPTAMVKTIRGILLCST